MSSDDAGISWSACCILGKIARWIWTDCVLSQRQVSRPAIDHLLVWTNRRKMSVPDMKTIIKQGQLVFGVAIAAFGVEGLICVRLDLKVRGIPWFPENQFLAYLTAIALLAGGLCIVVNFRVRLTATLLGILFLLYVLLLEIHRVAAEPMSVSVRTVFFETLAMCGSALTLAGSLRTAGTDFRRWEQGFR